MLILFALLFLSCGAGSIYCSTVPDNSTDMLSLLDFMEAISNDPNGVLRSWNESTHFCRWKGVTCSPTHPGRVVTLDLAGQGLAGSISSSLGNLTFLHTLDLSINHFSGQLPPLNHLHRLQVLNLTRNSLEGNIPDTLTNCSNLLKLDLSYNMLEGAIPPKIGFLSNLDMLVLNQNNLSGSIPPNLNNITNLEILLLAYNQLEGSIPDELGQLSNLSWLSLGQNNLSGEIPQGIYNMSSLQKLSLHTNMLGKVLPPNMGDTLPKIQSIYLGSNKLEGLVPASLGNASSVAIIDLNSNSFSGQIPSSLGKLSSLLLLNLGWNKLEASESWQFLYALSNCSFLQVLSLSNNQLTGVIPNSIGNLPTSLQHLYLGGNNLFEGMVPRSIGNLSGLIALGLDTGNLTGTIEEWIWRLKSLQFLNLSQNNFIGSIPSTIGNLTQLSKFYLGNNAFEGTIPPTVGNLPLLELDVSFNNFEGNIPEEISNLKQLIHMYLSSNKLTGEIPASLGQCQGLTTLRMDRNFLLGTIPISFDRLYSLSTLNLSHNNLSGTIPIGLSNLSLLTVLDLSHNDLQGEIPRNGVFANAADVSLDGNRGLCGGVIDLHMPSCQAVSRRTEKQYYLIRVLIPIFGFMSLVLLVYFLLLVKKTTRRKYVSMTSFGKNFLKVSYSDLVQATRNFSESNLVGRGSYGSVYRGKLKEHKMEVAVKVFDLEMRGAERSFMSECEALRNIVHRNLLPIITACSTVDTAGNVFKALVYEFMPNGNLDTWLHHKGNGTASKCLGLDQRISIAVNIADALDYLHHDCGRPTVHCDLKPSNILLDDDMNALLGDFGIARFYVDSWSTSTGSISSIGVKGTIGYIAPEYGRGGHVSTSGDVYSFGILLLEMMTGKRPTDPIFNDGLDIVNFVESNVPHQIFNAIDAYLVEECKDSSGERMAPENAVYQCLVSLLQLALSCTRPLPGERMNMKQIASKIHAIKTSHLGCEAKKPGV